MRTHDKYVLKGHEPVRCDDLMKWAFWFEHSDRERQVALTEIGESRISTVFLALDFQHSANKNAPPILFETLVMGGPLEDQGGRCSTWDEAEAMHESMVERVQKETPNLPKRAITIEDENENISERR